MRQLGFEVGILDVRDGAFALSLATEPASAMVRNLSILDSIAPGSSITPCTFCYNSKVIGLASAAAQLKAPAIVFAHHATDAVASLLKSALMYIDRWDRQHAVYSRAQFADLVEHTADDFLRAGVTSPSFARVKELVYEGCAATDEPPVQPLLMSWTSTVGLRVIRPLFDVWEPEIVAFFADSGLTAEDSGCGHSATAAYHTPRELVHHGLLDRLVREGARELVSALASLVVHGLTPDGRLKINVRNERVRLLGDAYRGEVTCEPKL